MKAQAGAFSSDVASTKQFPNAALRTFYGIRKRVNEAGSRPDGDALYSLKSGNYRATSVHFKANHTRGVQKVRSLIQFTTEYEHDILSVFNIVPFNRNALSPVILQSPCSIIVVFLILVLQPVTRSADNIIVISKSPSFHEFLQFWKQIEVIGGQIWQIRWLAEQFITCISDGSQCL